MNKEKWTFSKWDKIWSFHTNIQWLVRFEAGKMSHMKALWAFTFALVAFVVAALVLLMAFLLPLAESGRGF